MLCSFALSRSVERDDGTAHAGALARLDPHLPPAAQLAQAVERTVRWTVRTIIESPEGQARAVEGRVKCVGAIYEIETGRVRFLEPLVGHGAGAVWETAAKGTDRGVRERRASRRHLLL